METNNNVARDIELLEWNQIEEEFDIDARDVERDLKKPNYCNNFWYPVENGFNLDEALYACRLFELRYPEITIKSKHDVRYLEIPLNTLEKHQFAYTLIKLLKQD
mgnify:CR=1 FL=1